MEDLGITVQFRGETTQFEGAVKKVNNELKATKSDLSLINKQLKLDPTSVEKLSQKYKLLKDLQSELTEKVETYKQAMEGLERGTDEWNKLNKELEKAQIDLDKLNKELAEMPTANIQAVTKHLDDMGNKLTKAGQNIENIGKKFSVLSAGMIGLGTAGVKFNAQLEQYQTAFTTLIGDADKAAEAIKNIQTDSASTPFSTDALIEANQYLIAAGVSADDARKTIMALGDAVSATGGGSNELSRMAQNLQQIKNVGKASAVDIKQFANAGINIYGMLAKTTGKTVKELQKMDITFDALNEALQTASSEGGIYFGAMAEQSQTLNGSISTLKDSFNVLLGELTSSLTPIIKEIIGYVNELITKVREMSPQQKEMITRIGLLIAVLGPALVVIGKIVATVGALSTNLSTLITFVTQILNPFTAVLAVLGVLYATNEDFRNSVNNLALAVWNALKPALESLWEIAKTVWEIFKQIVEIIIDLWNEFKKTKAAEIFKATIQGVMDFLLGFIGVIGSVIDAVSNLFSWISNTISKAHELNGISIRSGGSFSGTGAFTSGGFGSGGYSSGGITLNANFNVSSNNIGRQDVRAWSHWLVEDLNEALGKEI